MENNYLIEGEDFVSIKSTIKNIINDNDFSDSYINYYDLEENTLDEVLEDLNTYSFLSPKKVIVLKNAYFLESTPNKTKVMDDLIESLIKYIENPSNDILFIICVGKIDSRKNLGKTLKTKMKYIKCSITPQSIINTYLSDYKMDFKTRNLLLEYTDNNISKLTKECEKLQLFKLDDKTITESDIKSIVYKTKKDTDKMLFDLVYFIASRNKEKAFKLYLELLDYNYTPIDVVGKLASQLRLIYQIKLMGNSSSKEIADTLDVHPYRVEKSTPLAYKFTMEEIKDMILKLAKLDLDIKSGMKDSVIAFKMFLINL